MSEIMTTKELATRLKTSEHQIRVWYRNGLIPCLKMGHRTVRFNWDDVIGAMTRLGDPKAQEGV